MPQPESRITKLRLSAFPILGMAFAIMLVMFLFWQHMKSDVDNKAAKAFDIIAQYQSEILVARMHDYERVLWGASGLFNASKEVSRQEWKDYYEALHLDRSLPGIQGLGYSIIFPKEALAQKIELIRNEGFPNFTVYPDGDRDIYSAIIYIEPFEDRNLQAFGYDMYSESVRHQAMSQAMATGLPAWSGKVTLVQEVDQAVQPGFLVYLPLYQKGFPVRQEHERAEAIQGFVYSAFRAHDMMFRVFEYEDRSFELALYDGLVEPSNLLYKTTSLLNHKSKYSNCKAINIGGAAWTACFSSNARFESQQHYDQANLLFGSGIVILSLVVFGLLIDSRKRDELTLSNQELENNIRDAKVLADLTDLLQSCMSLDEAYPIIASNMQRLFPHTAGDCYILNNSGTALVSQCSWGESNQAVELFPPSDCWAIKRSALHHGNGGEEAHVRCRHLDNHSEFTVCVPMMTQGNLLGTLSVTVPQQPHGKGEAWHEDALLNSVAEIIALALSNLQLRESLKELSMRDALTGLYNRRFMEESLNREVARAHRTESVFAVVMLDIDFFKKFNDTYGHEVGDVVLKKVAAQLNSFRLSYDVICRYGGEEFLLILSDIDAQTAVRRLEELRESVQSMSIQVNGESIRGVTLSMGVALYPGDGLTPDELIQNADGALYEAKALGRNKVVFVSNNR